MVYRSSSMFQSPGLQAARGSAKAQNGGRMTRGSRWCAYRRRTAMVAAGFLGGQRRRSSSGRPVFVMALVLRWATSDGKKLAGRGSMLQSSWRRLLALEVLVGNESSGSARPGRRAAAATTQGGARVRGGAGKLGYAAR
jgi:hypothetical protein